MPRDNLEKLIENSVEPMLKIAEMSEKDAVETFVKNVDMFALQHLAMLFALCEPHKDHNPEDCGILEAAKEITDSCVKRFAENLKSNLKITYQKCNYNYEPTTNEKLAQELMTEIRKNS